MPWTFAIKSQTDGKKYRSTNGLCIYCGRSNVLHSRNKIVNNDRIFIIFFSLQITLIGNEACVNNNSLPFAEESPDEHPSVMRVPTKNINAPGICDYILFCDVSYVTSALNKQTMINRVFARICYERNANKKRSEIFSKEETALMISRLEKLYKFNELIIY